MGLAGSLQQHYRKGMLTCNHEGLELNQGGCSEKNLTEFSVGLP